MDHTLLKLLSWIYWGRKLTSSEKLRLMDYLAKDSSQDLSSPTNANHDRESLTIHLLQKSKLPTKIPQLWLQQLSKIKGRIIVTDATATHLQNWWEKEAEKPFPICRR